MSVDVHDYTQPDPRCKCRQVHGNADTDGICSFCRPAFEAAYEAGCAICGEPGDPRSRSEDNLCAACEPEEPGDAFYEGRG